MTGTDAASFAVSADGRKLVYQASADGKDQLFVRTLESDKAQLLMGTVLAFFTCGLSLVAAVIWGVVEGIICLVGGMPDAEGRPLSV